MAFEDNKKFWKEFIELYREHTCLWDVNSKDYSNRNVRNRAYNALVLKCKEKFPTAEKYFVAKKINSLRTSFRRQFRKIQESTDEFVEPTLWYFDLLLFTLDQEELRAGLLPNVNDELVDEDITINETDSQHEYIIPDNRIEHDSDAAHPYSPQPAEQELPPAAKKRKRQKDTVSSADSNKKDSASIFGEFVADSMRNLKNKRLQSWVRHQVCNVLYTAEQAHYQNLSEFPKPESLNFSVDTSTLPNSQCEGESRTSQQAKQLKRSVPVIESVSTSRLDDTTATKHFEMYFKEEPPFSDPQSPSN